MQYTGGRDDELMVIEANFESVCGETLVELETNARETIATSLDKTLGDDFVDDLKESEWNICFGKTGIERRVQRR